MDEEYPDQSIEDQGQDLDSERGRPDAAPDGEAPRLAAELPREGATEEGGGESSQVGEASGGDDHRCGRCRQQQRHDFGFGELDVRGDRSRVGALARWRVGALFERPTSGQNRENDRGRQRSACTCCVEGLSQSRIGA